MANNRNLEEPLISSGSRGFGVSNEQLKGLFDLDAIRERTSNSRLKSMGGTAGLIGQLKTSPSNGINVDDASENEQRKQAFGENLPILKVPKGFLELCTEQFEDKILKILTGAAFVSLILGIYTEGWEQGWLEGFTIFLAVAIIVLVTATNNYLKEQQFQKLNAQRELREVSVIRNGRTVSVSIYKLLVGDVMHITTGEMFPVDGLLIKNNDITVDESSMTGESHLIKKTVLEESPDDKAAPFLISGSKVMEGTGLMVVLSLGQSSVLGQMKLKLQEETPPTSLQLKLATVADDIGKLGMYAAIGTFSLMLLHYIIERLISGQCLFCMESLLHLVDFFIVAVTIIVVAVPEGLPLAVTIALAYSVNKMKDENNLVRVLASCEVMGGANNICSDKTGTLTQNRMSVEKLWIEESTRSTFSKNDLNPDLLQVLCEGICVNSDAFPEKTKDGKYSQIGNKTECALLELALKLGHDYTTYRPSDKIKKVIPFSSARKRMSTIYETKVSGEPCLRVFVKGASEIVLDRCSELFLSNGNTKPLRQQTIEDIKNNVIKTFAKQSLRTIAIAYKDLRGRYEPNEPYPEEMLESDLHLVAIAGIKDPIRPEIPEAVRKCKEAGIRVRMVTGDNLDTAVAIAKECGILTPDFEPQPNSYTVMEGKHFREYVGGLVQAEPDMSEDDKKTYPRVKEIRCFEQVARDLSVLARSSPDDKYLLVTGLRQLNNVVAVTGDGTNDAPALKKADVGFAMGIAGTEVAREAAAIILLDDNFNSIVTAVKWGRNIYDSIRKFLQFQLTVNIVAVFMAFLGGVILRESPLNPIQMLWVNLIMDTFASLALATEPPTDELLKRQPYGKNEHLVTPMMWRNIIGQAVFQIFLLSIILFEGEKIFGVKSSRNVPSPAEKLLILKEKGLLPVSMSEMGDRDEIDDIDSEDLLLWNPKDWVHYTIFFNTFVFLQVFNEINCRKLKSTEINVFENFFNNYMFIVILIGTTILQLIFVELGGQAIKCSQLSMKQHFVCILLGACSLGIGYLIKTLPTTLFERVDLLRETPMSLEQVDQSLIAMVRQPSFHRGGTGKRDFGKQGTGKR